MEIFQKLYDFIMNFINMIKNFVAEVRSRNDG